MNCGGPAFPTHGFNDDPGNAQRSIWPENGMTLRDYFAAKALLTLRACDFGHDGFLAERAYHIADAMLAVRDNAHSKPEREALQEIKTLIEDHGPCDEGCVADKAHRIIVAALNAVKP